MAETGSCRIITSPGYGGVEEKNSRFLSEALFVDSEEAARSELARVRKQYYDARHHCSAWIIGPGGETVRSGDDGEPAGTAGRPILEVIRGAGVTNAMVVVTRYFGGTLLGTGGHIPPRPGMRWSTRRSGSCAYARCWRCRQTTQNMRRYGDTLRRRALPRCRRTIRTRCSSGFRCGSGNWRIRSGRSPRSLPANAGFPERGESIIRPVEQYLRRNQVLRDQRNGSCL